MTMLSTDTLCGESVCNPAGEDLGKIEDFMLNVNDGSVQYAVLSFGGIMGLGDKLFAVPMRALNLDTDKEKFILNVPKEKLEDAPGFDKDNWPNMADPSFATDINRYYGLH